MRTRHALGAAAAGLALVAAGVATPSAASAAAVIPNAVTMMSSTVDASVSAKKPSHVTKKAHQPKQLNHGRSKHALQQSAKHVPVPPKTRASTNTPHASDAGAAAPRAVVSGTPTTTSTSPRIRPKPIPDVLQQVATAVQDAFTLFGWNLLALVPMAAIAVTLSRRIRSPRRSVWG